MRKFSFSFLFFIINHAMCFVPFGPLINIRPSFVTDFGFVECFRISYSSDGVKPVKEMVKACNLSDSWVFVGALQTITGNISLGGFGKANIMFNSQFGSSCAKTSLESNGLHWYFGSSCGFGFANVTLNQLSGCDVDDYNGKSRLCWTMAEELHYKGYRVGTSKNVFSALYDKVVYVNPSNNTKNPTVMPSMKPSRSPTRHPTRVPRAPTPEPTPGSRPPSRAPTLAPSRANVTQSPTIPHIESGNGFVFPTEGIIGVVVAGVVLICICIALEIRHLRHLKRKREALFPGGKPTAEEVAEAHRRESLKFVDLERVRRASLEADPAMARQAAEEEHARVEAARRSSQQWLDAHKSRHGVYLQRKWAPGKEESRQSQSSEVERNSRPPRSDMEAVEGYRPRRSITSSAAISPVDSDRDGFVNGLKEPANGAQVSGDEDVDDRTNVAIKSNLNYK